MSGSVSQEGGASECSKPELYWSAELRLAVLTRRKMNNIRFAILRWKDFIKSTFGTPGLRSSVHEGELKSEEPQCSKSGPVCLVLESILDAWELVLKNRHSACLMKSATRQKELHKVTGLRIRLAISRDDEPSKWRTFGTLNGGLRIHLEEYVVVLF